MTTTAFLAGKTPTITIDTGVLIASPERTGITRECEVIADSTDQHGARRLYVAPKGSSALWIGAQWIVTDYRSK